MRQKEVPGRYCRSNICRGFRHLQSYPCQGAPKVWLFFGYREDFTCSGGVNPPCAKVFACGENACTAQRRRRPEGRSFRVVNIQIDLALYKKPWNFNGSRVFLFALNCKILVHCRPGGVLNLIFCISANHIFDAIACQKFILDVCHLCNKEPGISKRGM